MRVLIVKTSSLGDVIHTLPAVTDACAAHPGLRCDWVVEESLAEIPAWHRGVGRVIPVALRRWRRRPLEALRAGEWQRFRAALRERRYDRVIDAQGLIKSAWLTRQAALAEGGRRCGLDRASAREPWAAFAYHQRCAVARDRHAVDRVRDLFAQCLGYTPPATAPDFGLDRTRLAAPREEQGPYLVFLHATSWASKHWPQPYWHELIRLALAHGYRVCLPWGSTAERARARALAAGRAGAWVPERLSLTAVAGLLAGARAVVAVDTGLAHLAAALGVPAVTLYGATRPGLTGTLGPRQRHLSADFECAPCLSRVCRYRGASTVTPACYATLPPERVWVALAGLLDRGADAAGAGAQREGRS